MIDLRAISNQDLLEVEQEERPHLILDISENEIRSGVRARGIVYPTSNNYSSYFPPLAKHVFEAEEGKRSRMLGRILDIFQEIQDQYLVSPHPDDPDLANLYEDAASFFKGKVESWGLRQRENALAEWAKAVEGAMAAKGKKPKQYGPGKFGSWPHPIRVYYKGVDLAETQACRSRKPDPKSLGAEGVDLFTGERGPLFRKSPFRVKGMVVGAGLNDKATDPQSWHSQHNELTGLVYNPVTISNLWKILEYRMQEVPVRITKAKKEEAKKEEKKAPPYIYALTKDREFLDNIMNVALDPDTLIEGLKAAIYGRDRDAVLALDRSTAGLSLTLTVKQKSNAIVFSHTHGSFQQLSKAVGSFAAKYQGVSLKHLIEASHMTMQAGSEAVPVGANSHVAKWFHRLFNGGEVTSQELAQILDIRERVERSAQFPVKATRWSHFDWMIQGISRNHRIAQEAIMKTAFTQDQLVQSPYYHLGRMISAVGSMHLYHYWRQGNFRQGRDRSLATVKSLSAIVRSNPTQAILRMKEIFKRFEFHSAGRDRFKALYQEMPTCSGPPSVVDRIALLKGRFDEEDTIAGLIEEEKAKKKEREAKKAKAAERTPSETDDEDELVMPWDE